MTLVICTVLVGSIFTYYFYIRRALVRPLGALHRAALGLVEHSMDHLNDFRVDIHTGDEVEDLA